MTKFTTNKNKKKKKKQKQKKKSFKEVVDAHRV